MINEHERALKARARELGVSQAELVRRVLDGLLLDGEGEGLPGLALRRHWKVSLRKPTGWRSPTASREGMCSTETSSPWTAYEDPLRDGHSFCGGHNVLVYALDRREPEKRERAREVLRRVGGGARTAALPAQVHLRIRGRVPEKARAPAGSRSDTAGGRAPHARLPHSCHSPAPWCSKPFGASGSSCFPMVRRTHRNHRTGTVVFKRQRNSGAPPFRGKICIEICEARAS